MSRCFGGPVLVTTMLLIGCGPVSDASSGQPLPTDREGAVVGAPAPEAAPTEQRALVDPELQELPSLRGRWSLSSLNGDRLPPEQRIVVDITPTTIRARSGCVPFWWTYELSADSLRATREKYPDPVCMRGLSQWERGFENVVSGASKAALQGDMLILRGSNGEATLSREGSG